MSPELLAKPAGIILLDGKLSEEAWKQSVFTNLDGFSPANAKDNEIADKYQVLNSVRGAYLWDKQGLYVGMLIKDRDIQANKHQKNDWLWLEDVCELFMSKNRSGRSPHLELQVSPGAVRYEFRMQGKNYKTIKSLTAENSVPKYDVAVHVNGSVNDSKNIDDSWSVEWFVSWDALRQSDLLVDDVGPTAGQVVMYSRLANWNISIYSYYRVLRYLLPGSADPHIVKSYLPVRLVNE